MNKSDLIKAFIEDPLLVEKGYLTELEQNEFDSKKDHAIFIELLKKLIRDTDTNNTEENKFKGVKAVTNTLNRYLDQKL